MSLIGDLIIPVSFRPEYVPYEEFENNKFKAIEAREQQLNEQIKLLEAQYNRPNEYKEKYNSMIIETAKGPVQILNYYNSKHVLIVFLNSGFKNITRLVRIFENAIEDPFRPTVYGVGYPGIGPYNGINNVKIYSTWEGMMRRCYSTIESDINKNSTYQDCTVHQYWHNYQNFATWFDFTIYNFPLPGPFQLDKDVLSKGNKIYSMWTCCLLPAELNVIFSTKRNRESNLPSGIALRDTGKYKVSMNKYGNRTDNYYGQFDTVNVAFIEYKYRKEQYIHAIAEQYKILLPPNVYCALRDYEVSIDDIRANGYEPN